MPTKANRQILQLAAKTKMRIQQSQRKHPPKVKAKIKLFQRTTKSNINQN
jgi:hypothetical protein